MKFESFPAPGGPEQNPQTEPGAPETESEPKIHFGGEEEVLYELGGSAGAERNAQTPSAAGGMPIPMNRRFESLAASRSGEAENSRPAQESL